MALRDSCTGRTLATWAILLLHAVCLRAEDPGGKVPVPEAAAQARATRLVREVFGEQVDSVRTSAEKLALANNLLDEAKKTEGDPAGRFVLLRMAREMATEAGDAETACRATDEITQAYQIDALTMRVETLCEVARSARTAEQNTRLVERSLPVVDQLVAEDRYDDASRLGKVALAAAREAEDRTLVKEAVASNKKSHQTAEAHAALKEPMATLEQNPIDPEANLAVGRFLCLTKGDWDRGVPMLALGADAALKALAKKELQRPTSADEQAALADGWWDLGKTERGPAGTQMKRRAYDWYRRAEAGLTGLGLVTAQKRIELLLDEMPELAAPIPVGEVHCFEGQTVSVFSPDSRRMLVGGRDGTFQLWDVRSKRELRRFEGHTRPVESLCFSPDGRLVVSGAGDGTIRVWDPGSATQLRSFPAATPTFRPLPVVSADGTRLLCYTGNDKTVRVFDLEGGEPLHEFAIRGRAAAFVIAFSQDGRWALAGGLENKIRLWDVASGKLAIFLDGQTHVYAGALSPDGRFALTGGADNLVRLWDLATKRELCRLQGHTGHVYAAALSPDGHRVLSGSVDATVRLWDLTTAQQIHCYRGHTKPVTTTSFSPDGRLALSCSQDRTVRLWGLPE